MITTTEYAELQESLKHNTIDNALLNLKWLVYVQDVVTLDHTIEQAINILQSMVPAVNAKTQPDYANGEFVHIRQMISAAISSGLQYPSIRLKDNTPEQTGLHLAYNGKGQINMTNGIPFGHEENVWFGRIELSTGKINWNRKLKPATQSLLESMIEAFEFVPTGYAKTYGKETGNCMFCRKELTDSRSVAHGYGPTCAAHYGLHWGVDHVNQTEMQLEAEQNDHKN